MNSIWLHFKFRMTELRRQPTYMVTSLIFPSMFFWFFGVPNATTAGAAQLLMASFSSFAVLGVVLFQLATQIANEKGSPWSIYLHTLPVRSSHVLIARLLTQGLFALLSVCAVVLVAHLTVTVDLPKDRWIPFYLAVYFGGLPFASLGLLLGTIFNSRVVVPVSNLVYLPLSFAGGLWMPPNALPKLIQDISEYLPTRMYAEVVWAATLNKEMKSWNVIGLIFYMIFFLLVAIYFYRRDEGERFG